MRTSFFTLLVLLLGACATTPESLLEITDDSGTKAVVKPKKPARLKVSSDYDFTIEESVRIPSMVRREYDAALALLSVGRLEDGTQALLVVTAQVPELTAPHVDLGIAYLKQGKFDQAEDSLKTALALTPRHPVAANELGIVYRSTGRFVLARRSFEQALESFPNFHYAQLNLGVLCDLFLNDLLCAAAQYRDYQRAVPEASDLRIWIADVEARLAKQAESDS